MRLLNSMGPNPRMVRMFMIEKGIEVEVNTISWSQRIANLRIQIRIRVDRCRPWSLMMARFWQRQ